MVAIQSPTSCKYAGCDEMATMELVRSLGMNFTMLANGMPLSGPNSFCNCGINSATEARCNP
ncbi:hypothetical protein D3C76_802840 [compost metagenome]